MAVEDNFKTKQDLPATSRQTNLLYHLTGIDYSSPKYDKDMITRGEAGRMIRGKLRKRGGSIWQL